MADVTEQVKVTQRERFRPYGEYRSSGVEWLARLPSHWEVTPVKAALIRNDSGVWGEDFDEDGTIVLRSTEQTMQGTWRIEEPARRRLSAREADYARLREGDLLVTKSSGSAHHIGKTSIVDESVAALNCCYSNFMQRLRVSAEHFPRFVWYFMNCPVAREQLVFLSSTTTGLGNLNGSTLGAIRMPMAPPDEQRAIAAFLDRETAKIDALVARKERLIELLQEKRTALITRAVTRGLDPNVPMKDSGVEWLGEIPAHWETTKIKRIFKQTKRQGFPDRTVLSVYREYGVIEKSSRDDNFNRTPEDLDSYQLVDPGDLVINKMKAWQGSLGISSFSGITSPDYVVYTPRHKADERFLHHFLRCKLLASIYLTISNGIRPNQWRLEPERFEDLNVLLPPLAEQDQVATFLDSETTGVDALITKVRAAVDRLKEFHTALISATVTGKIDVREAVPQ